MLVWGIVPVSAKFRWLAYCESPSVIRGAAVSVLPEMEQAAEDGWQRRMRERHDAPRERCFDPDTHTARHQIPAALSGRRTRASSPSDVDCLDFGSSLCMTQPDVAGISRSLRQTTPAEACQGCCISVDHLHSLCIMPLAPSSGLAWLLI